jgi:cytochrome c biogenesis protein CcdA/thiol-disulfide isomerase/thioredoxin
MLALLLFAFLSGLVTILAPCIWPLLPIVLSSSISGEGGHRRPLGITLGIMFSFTLFTLFISYIVKLFHIDPNVLRLVAVVVLGGMGVLMVIPGFATLLELGLSRMSGIFSRSGSQDRSGFGSGFIAGLSLGIVWSPCAGPILAAIATLAATGQVSLQVILVTLAYVSGVGIPLFLFAFAGQKFLSGSRKLSPFTGRIQQVFGVIMILTAILIYSNKIQDFQLALVDRFPILNTVFNGFETNSTVSEQLNKLRNGSSQQVESSDLFNITPQQAPEFRGITQWLNNPNGSGKESSPLTMAELKGKVVLIDFWTYTCINCIRTLPHVTSWYNKYHDKGFTVIGVHTPEFAFEKDTENVLSAIKRFNIHYPVAQDNDYGTWTAYSNQYWPAEYLVDAKGMVRRVHFGEGEYDKMEEAIQQLLTENGAKVSSQIDSMPDQTPTGQLSPETYLGSKRMLYLSGSGKAENGNHNFPIINNVDSNHFAFAGEWNIADEYSSSDKDAAISYNFYAGKVYLVMSPEQVGKSSQVKVLLDGKLIDPKLSGKDVLKGMVTVDSDRLYDLVDLQGKTESHVLTLQFPTKGTQVFAFTFGN